MTFRSWLAALMALAVLAPAAAHAGTWWQKDWPYRKQLTIDTTSKGVQVSQPIGRAPLLIRLHSGNFTFDESSESGTDLRFVAGDDKTPMAYHIESFDPVVGVATIWVDVKDLPVAATQNFYMYYGNKKATPALDTQGTFDPDYVLVYHFDAAAGAPPKDKTAYGNNATTAPAGIDDGSVIGKGARMTGAGAIQVPASPSLALAAGGAFTFSAWIKQDSFQPRAALFVRQEGGASLLIGIDQGVPFVEAGGQKLAASTPIGKGAWSHVAVTSDGHALTLFVNGKQAGTAPASLPAFNGPIALGADLPGGASGLAPFIGGLDEVRISKVARTAGVIAVDAASQGADSRLVAFGADEKPAGIGFGLFGVIVKSVDGTAWFVIGLLGVMSALSWTVLVTKVRYANTADRANETFLKMFRELGPNVTLLADDEAVGAERLRRLSLSPIYRIYRAGASEIRLRERKGGHVVLRAEAIEVVRALMDATLVRENQKLGKNIVWLTIAISGGPFLGLLGTVVGVMLTFAAVAAAGDVNINAIAPGISAALLATVAGLAVAIPAMFGYNYVLIRNKNITANLHVFVDEFVTRLSEYYSDAGYAQAAE